MTTTPTELRALADRVCAEEPSDELRDAIQDATDTRDWVPDSGDKIRLPGPNPLHSRDDAAAMMAAGWRIRDMLEQVECGWTIEIWKMGMRRIIVTAPTEPRARTAAALRVRAAMMESDNAD